MVRIISQSRSLLFQPGNTGGGKRPFMSDESALLNGLHSEERTHHSCKELWLVASHVCTYQRSTTNPTFQHHAVVEAKIPTSQSGPHHFSVTFTSFSAREHRRRQTSIHEWWVRSSERTPFRRADSSLMQGAVAGCITCVYLPAKYNKSDIPTPCGSWS